jgi:hypothetical protein
MTERGSDDDVTPAPLFDKKKDTEEPVVQQAAEELPQPIRPGFFERMLAKLRGRSN